MFLYFTYMHTYIHTWKDLTLGHPATPRSGGKMGLQDLTAGGLVTNLQRW